jgi:rhamnogalacturonan endolyase
MHAFADGVLGEYARTNVTVEPGKPIDFGKITWTPVRRGKQIWEIGIPNRSGREFFKGDVYWTPNITSAYAELFPNDITYTIGKSDFTKDWFFAHVPHLDPTIQPPPRAGRGGFGARGPASGPAGFARGPASAPAFARRGAPTTGPAARGRGGIPGGFAGGFPPAAYGRATPRTIVFDLPAAPHGKATLRIAFAGNGATSIGVMVNDKEAGQLDHLISDGVLSDHGQHGIWNEREFSFDAGMMKQGTNTLTITVPQGNVNNGALYDYLRLELDEAASPTAMAQ